MILTRTFRETWGIPAKIIFRFLFIYSLLYISMTFFGLLTELPMRWFARTILGWKSDFSTTATGSGDTTFHYVQWFFVLFSAIGGTLIWTVLDWKRKAYNHLAYWYRVLLRYYLFFFMMNYGMVKIFKMQFADIALYKLLQPIGELSPMGLAWTYMGHSVAYNMFVGWGEVLGGLLLLSRRTQTLGALIVIGVMSHVAMMNFTYDIPVKLFSVHLVFFAVLLFLTDIRRFVNVFLQNKTTKSISETVPSNDSAYKNIIRGLKIVLILALFGMFSFQAYTVMETRETNKAIAPFYGIWKPKLFIKNRDTLPPLQGDSLRWKYVVMENKKRTLVTTMADARLWLQTNIDTTQQRLGWSADEQADSIPLQFNYRWKHADTLRLDGLLEQDTLSILLIRKNLSDFELIERKFNWINEYPHNR